MNINENDIYFEKSNNSKSFRSTETQDVLTGSKSFLIQWGLYIILFIIILLFIAANFIYYPDIITTRARLTGYNAPKEIIARQEGKLVKLFVTNDNIVNLGDPLMWIEATANHTEVIKLGNLLDSCINLLNDDSAKDVDLFSNVNFNQLGELQTGYQDFLTNYQLYKDFFINGYYQKNLDVLNKDLNGIVVLNNNFNKQKNIIEDDIKLIQQSFSANERLYNEKIISKQELRNEKSKLLNRQQSIPQIEASILTNNALLREKKKQINDLEHTLIQQRSIFFQSLQTLKSLVDEWKRNYIVSASEKGKVVFTIPLQENQHIINGKILGYINPNGSYYFVEMNLPQKNFGKVFIGQKVQLRFDAYPHNEFGYIKGKITYISNVSSDTGFVAKVELTEGLVTSQKTIIQYNNGLNADALIIIKDLTILDRLIFSLIKNVTR
jgi:HlyD family secretion protein